MENYTLDDIKTFLKRKGYTWKGEIWYKGYTPRKVDITELYGRTRPIIQFVLYKDGQKILQDVSIFDTRLVFWQEGLSLSATKNMVVEFKNEHDYSKEWADFLARRHNGVIL